MDKLKQNLYITYSNQKARDLKLDTTIKPLDKIITLDSLILELYESNNFEIIIDDMIGASIMYKIIQNENISYFDYLDSDAVSLNTIYKFIIKSNRNDVSFDTILKSDKLNALIDIDKFYTEYKIKYNLVDISDIEKDVLLNWDKYFYSNYKDIFIDDFNVSDISYLKSLYQDKILEKLSKYKKIPTRNIDRTSTKLIKPSNEVFDTIDEVKTAIRISRKLLEEGVSSDDILIVASDIAEYASLYKLFLSEYEIKGYSSLGTPLSSYFNTNNPQVQIALNSYNATIKSLEFLYKKLGLKLTESTKQNIKASQTILDEKIGIELTEANQILGLSKKYEHIIFIGTDINHFPPKAVNNFLYTYDDEINYFKANNYFTSSQTQYEELKRLSENLYIITASYREKRELTASIIIDTKFDEIIDISDVKSINQLSFENKTNIPDINTKIYYESIISTDKTHFDGDGVEDIKATHLSASQINKYITCPLQYLYTNKLRVQAPKQNDEGFDVMEQGSLMHLCYELFGKKIKENHITDINQEYLYNIMYDISIEAYHHHDTVEPRGKDKLVENIHHQIFLTTLQAGLKDERSAGLLAKFVNYYIANANEFNYFKNTEFEKEFALDSNLQPYILKGEDDKNYFIKGFIDRFDNLENHINIVDYKSKKVKNPDKKKQEEVDTQKDIQLALYILYAKHQYPSKIYDSYLLSFKGNDKGVKFASLSSDGKYSFEYEEDLKKLIIDTKDSIEAGRFIFNNSDEKMCGYCDVKNICHESVLSKGRNDGK